MDVLVLLDECGDEATTGRALPPGGAVGERPLAYVHSAPDPRDWAGAYRRRDQAQGREVVTLCGTADASRLAVALAAAIEGRRAEWGPLTAVRHLGVWEGLGATGDSAWRDRTTGELVSRDVVIPASTVEATARQLLLDAGRIIRQTVAELATPDWPEGARRAISFTLPVTGDRASGRLSVSDELADDALLALLREADGESGADQDTEPAVHELPGERAA
jgi:hypothetical protein